MDGRVEIKRASPHNFRKNLFVNSKSFIGRFSMPNIVQIFYRVILVIGLCLFSMKPSVTNASQMTIGAHFTQSGSNGTLSSNRLQDGFCRCSFLNKEKQIHLQLDCSWTASGLKPAFFSVTVGKKMTKLNFVYPSGPLILRI
jgi:hypothetical protein